MKSEIRRIGFILFDQADLLDVVGPAAVFSCAARQLARSHTPSSYRVDYLSLSGGPTRTLEGLAVETLKLRDLPAKEYHSLVFAGGCFDDRGCDPQLVAWLERNHSKVERLGSVCTGAYYLARAGILDGRSATTHWQDCADLAERFPKVQVDPDSIFVNDRGVWTSAGVTSGIDMALAMVEDDHGRELALFVARNLVVYLKRPGGQAQFSTILRAQETEGPFAVLLKWIAENPRADLRAEALAERAHMSLRNFYRAFEDATGTSPAEWVERARIELAKRLLEQTPQLIDQVARNAGFSSYERMRRAFSRRVGVTPAEYRARFARPKTLAADHINLRLAVDATLQQTSARVAGL